MSGDVEGLAELLAAHRYQGAYRMWCTCGQVEPLPFRNERPHPRPNVTALHRRHLADLIAVHTARACATAWDEGYEAGGEDWTDIYWADDSHLHTNPYRAAPA